MVGRLFTSLADDLFILYSYIDVRRAWHCRHRILVRALSPTHMHHIHCVPDLLVMVS